MEHRKEVSLAVALAVVGALAIAAAFVYVFPLESNQVRSQSTLGVTTTSLGPPATTIPYTGYPSQTSMIAGCIAYDIDEGKVIATVFNSSQVRQYTHGAFAFNWVYDTGQSCSSVKPALVEVNVTGLQKVSGNWSSQYVVTYANNTLLRAEVSSSYQMLNFTVTEIPDWSQNVVFTPQEKQVIGLALSNSTVKSLTGADDYFVSYASGSIGSGNQTFADDYYLVVDHVDGNLAVGVYVSSSLTGVLGVYETHVCRLFEANGNVCASP